MGSSHSSAHKNKEIEGNREAACRLKEAGIPLFLTTGYDRRMVDLIRQKLSWLDDVVQGFITSSDVREGRPAPYMIWRAMEAAGVKSPALVLNAGDTKVDVESSDYTSMPGVIVLTGSIKGEQEAKQVNLELGRDHLVAPVLTDVVDYVLGGTIVDRVRALN